MDEIAKRLERIERNLEEVLVRLGKSFEGARTELEKSAMRLEVLRAPDRQKRLQVLRTMNETRRRK